MNATTTKNVLVANNHAFEQEITRLNKRANKIGFAPITFKNLGPKTVTRTSVTIMEGEESVRTYPVTVTEYALTLPSAEAYRWVLAATITPMEDKQVFVDAHVKGFDITPWTSVDPCRCQHCHTSRARSLTYVVQNKDDGKFLQVGRNCFADYVGHRGLDQLEFCAFVASMFGEGDDDFIFPSGPKDVEVASVRDIISTAEALAEAMGSWRNNQKDEYTGEIRMEGTHRLASRIIRRRHAEDHIPAKTLSKLAELWATQSARLLASADAAIEEIKNIDFNGDEDDFGRTLQYCAQFEAVPVAKASLVAYTGQFLRNRKLRAEREAKKATMVYVGTVGKREDFRNLTLRKVLSFESQFGMRYVNIFNDDAGNELVWKTGSAAGNEGQKISLKGTVTAHEVRNGVPQTVLSRCKELA
jgi:hypothetical protein